MYDICYKVKPAITEQENELERIKSSFNTHIKEIIKYGLPDRFFDKKHCERIKKIICDMTDDCRDLLQLIKNINETIKKLKESKGNSVTQAIESGVLTITSIIAAGVSLNPSLFVANSVGAVTNGVGAIMNIINASTQCDLIDRMEDLLKKAEDLKKEILEKIDEVMDEIKNLPRTLYNE